MSNEIMQQWFEKIKDEMYKQTEEITRRLTESFEEKFRLIKQENDELRIKVVDLEHKVVMLEKEMRKNNLILHGVNETEKSACELATLIIKVLQSMNIRIEERDIIDVHKDYPKEIQEKRRNLQVQLQEERKQGNYAFIKYDQLIVRGSNKTEKRKRPESNTLSPPFTSEEENNHNPQKLNKINAFNYMRNRNGQKTNTETETTNK
ncbi:unnamed protein product [Diatraea saccharalis]|uniref:Uncharacterized protein n=1 Tax=Diatraea saccharalis TaxID=40085 RepID=A0A9N9R6J9_9NEOP|nr:unnamed protein product [Diatraea saccharalis]